MPHARSHVTYMLHRLFRHACSGIALVLLADLIACDKDGRIVKIYLGSDAFPDTDQYRREPRDRSPTA